MLFKCEGKKISIDKSATRVLRVCLKTIYPSLNILIKLIAVDHNCHVQISTDSWNRIVENSLNIKAALHARNEQSIFIDSHLEVFTEKIHNSCMVCFIDNEGQRVNLTMQTFKNMMKKSFELNSEFMKICNFIRDNAENYKLFVDYLKVKFNESNMNNPEVNDSFIDIYQYLNDLSNTTIEPNLDVEKNDYDYYDDSDEECLFCNGQCCRKYYRY